MITNAIMNLFSAISLDGSNPRDPAIAKMLGLGRQSLSGIDVTPEKVLALPAILRSMNIIGNSMAKLPWYVFRDLPEGKEFDREHPSWTCVSRKSNKFLTAGRLQKTLTNWAMGWGNGCAFIEAPNYPNGPIELIPLLPDCTRVVRYKAGGYDSDLAAEGDLMYATLIGGKPFTFEAHRVIHIRGFGTSPYWGKSVFDLVSETFGGAIATAEFGHRFFGQGANPAGFIESPSGMDEESEENFMASLRKASSGLGKSHKFILLEQGAKFHPVTVDPEKSQLVEGKSFDVRSLAMAIGIKVHKLIDGANNAFASLEQANQEHKDDDLVPWIQAWREEMNDKLLTEEQKRRGSHVIDVDDEQLEWVPFKDRTDGCAKSYDSGLITKDEGRRKLNWGPSGSKYSGSFKIQRNMAYEGEHMPVNTTQAGKKQGSQQTGQKQSGQTQENHGEPAIGNAFTDRAAFDALALAWLGNVRKRLCKSAEAKASKGAKEFLHWLDTLEGESAPEEIIASVCSLVDSVRARFNACADTATTDEELRSMIGESIETIGRMDLTEFLGRKKHADSI